MGISTRTVTEINCDLCSEECGASEGVIDIQINGGDGRDVGPSTLRAAFRLDVPYGVSGGIICKTCKLKWLGIYLDRNKPEQSND